MAEATVLGFVDIPLASREDNPVSRLFLSMAGATFLKGGLQILAGRKLY